MEVAGEGDASEVTIDAARRAGLGPLGAIFAR